MSKTLITGSSGFVGAAMVRAMPGTAVAFDLMEGWDLREREHLRKAVQAWHPTRILHLAAIARFSDADADPVACHEINVLGTRNVAAVAEEFHIPVVYGSTGSVYMPLTREPPITEDFPALGNSHYGYSKRLGELYIQQMRTPWIILRYAHLYGPEKRLHGLIGGYIDRIESGRAPVLHGGGQSNDFTYIDDVVSANLAALNAPPYAWKNIYNIGTGTELSAQVAGAIVCKAWGYSGPIETVQSRSVDPSRFVYDCSKAKRLLGWTPQVSFTEGMERMHRTLKKAQAA